MAPGSWSLNRRLLDVCLHQVVPFQHSSMGSQAWRCGLHVPLRSHLRPRSEAPVPLPQCVPSPLSVKPRAHGRARAELSSPCRGVFLSLIQKHFPSTRRRRDRAGGKRKSKRTCWLCAPLPPSPQSRLASARAGALHRAGGSLHMDSRGVQAPGAPRSRGLGQDASGTAEPSASPTGRQGSL